LTDKGKWFNKRPWRSDVPRKEAAASSDGRLYYRHRLPVRIMHWINMLVLVLLLMSGLQIFNAYPALYWGQSSYSGRPPLLAISAKQGADGALSGVTQFLGHTFNTTGVLGASSENGELSERAFPSWATIPGTQWLAMGRRWHLFFVWVFVVNGAAYVIYSIVSRHLERDLTPTKKDWRSIIPSIVEHVRFRHPTGEAAKHYNVLQKLTYLAVIFGLLPLIILMGWALSPTLDTVIPGWVDAFGGRQSARTIHFIVAWLLVAFVLVHVFEVIVSGLWNNLRSMINGRYRVPPDPQHEINH
jgi:thiosulfate reductase cytochrome b subunit